MRVRIAIGVGGGVAAVCVWEVLASRLFVWMGGLSAYFPTPWITWWLYFHQPRINGSTLTYLIISGLITALPLLLVMGIVVAALRINNRQPSLWGSTDFATRREMDRGGIKTKGELF